jgi:signal transduction histidine kinase
VTRVIVRELGGRVSIEHRPEGGTRVVVSIPLAEAELAHAAE